MVGKLNKLYVIIDPEEGILLINMNRDEAGRPLVGSTRTLAEMQDLLVDSEKAIHFATEFNNKPLADLRDFLLGYYTNIKFSPETGLKFCIGLNQTPEDLSTYRRKSTYSNINGELTELFGKENDPPGGGN